MFCCTLLYVHSSIAIILMGKRELIALLILSSWCLVMVERLFLAVPQGCLQFVIVVFPDHTHLLFLQPQGGGTLIFSYILRLGSFWGVQNFEFQYFWGLSEKLIFLGHEDYMDSFGAITKLDYCLGSFLCILGSFLKVKVQNGGYFWGLPKFQICFGGARNS